MVFDLECYGSLQEAKKDTVHTHILKCSSQFKHSIICAWFSGYSFWWCHWFWWERGNRG